MPQFAFIVDDTMFIKKRGLAIVPPLDVIEEIKRGDMIEIRSAEKQTVTVRVQKIDWQRRSDKLPPVVRQGEFGLILVDLPNGSVKGGDEVWTI